MTRANFKPDAQVYKTAVLVLRVQSLGAIAFRVLTRGTQKGNKLSGPEASTDAFQDLELRLPEDVSKTPGRTEILQFLPQPGISAARLHLDLGRRMSIANFHLTHAKQC